MVEGRAYAQQDPQPHQRQVGPQPGEGHALEHQAVQEPTADGGGGGKSDNRTSFSPGAKRENAFIFYFYFFILFCFLENGLLSAVQNYRLGFGDLQMARFLV